MFRNALIPLKEWLSAPQRKPMVLRGARQVGKTWLVRHFAFAENRQLIEINFERRPDFISLFNSNNPKQILFNLNAALDMDINARESLLFLDEIQAAPSLLAKLRWFAEDMPELAVIAAGSLLEFVLADHTFSMPVGRINYFHLEPLSLEEFLIAKNKNQLVKLMQTYQMDDEIPAFIHQQLMNEVKEYMFVGGMPAAIISWIKKPHLPSIQQIHHDILATYRDDFGKYANKVAIENLREVLETIPKMLGNKFKYSEVNRDKPAVSIKKALELLVQARVCHKVNATHANGVPLGAERKDKVFKVILLDVGLISSLLGLNLHQFTLINNINVINQGGISEQLVGQLQRINFPFYVEPALYYWIREKTGSSAEIDYVIQHESEVVPMEVKSGSTGSLKSLHFYMASKRKKIAIRINSESPSLTEVDVKTSASDSAHYQLLSLPFYLIGQIPRLLASIPQWEGPQLK